MIRTIGEPAENLRAHLATIGVDPSDIATQIDEVFGRTRLAVASGSIAAGYANASSDLDLYVITEGKGADAGATNVPIVSHELGILMDIFYWDADETDEMLEELRSKLIFTELADDPIQATRRTASSLARAVRLAVGAVVVESDDADPVLRSVRGDWLTERAADWWRFQAWRHELSAAWLADRRPIVARQNLCDAALFALKCEVTEAGFAYFNPKWIAIELSELGWNHRLASYRAVLSAAADIDEGASVSSATALTHEIVGEMPADIEAYIVALPGVEQLRVGRRTLVWRWDLNGVELDEFEIPTEGVLWRGAARDCPPSWVLDLVETGMAWTGLTRATV